MLTSSHAFWALRLPAAAGTRAWRTAGAITPDVPALVLGAAFARRMRSGEHLMHAIYHRPPWRQVHLALHSLPPALGLRVAARRRGPLRAYANGWLSHLAVDYATHHADAWPPLWPLRSGRWRSPVSYWQIDHHARAWAAAETAALGIAALTARRLPHRLAGLLPVALAAPGVLRGGRTGLLGPCGPATGPRARVRLARTLVRPAHGRRDARR